MSVINQALKKAQRQQLAHSMPRASALSSLSTPAVRRRRRLWRTGRMVGAVAFLGGGVLVYAWISAPSSPPAVHSLTPPKAATAGLQAPSGGLPQVASAPPEAPVAVPRVPARSFGYQSEIPLSQRPVSAGTKAGEVQPAESPGRAVMPEAPSPPPRQVASVPALPEPPALAHPSGSQTGSATRAPAAALGSRPQPAALLEQALRQQAAGDMAQARLLLEQVVGLDPADKVAYNSLGNVYYQQEQYEQAASMYGQALAIDPNYVKARNNLGSTYMRLGMESRALAELQQALQIDAAYGLTHYNLACLYARAGDGATAARYLQQAIEREPQARDWAQSDADFVPVRTAPALQALLGGVR